MAEPESDRESRAPARCAACVTVGLVCALALLLGALVGCSLLPAAPAAGATPEPPASTPSPEPAATATPSGTVSLLFWEPFPLDRPQGILLGELARDYQAENPAVQIEVVAKSGYTGLHESMLAEMPGGSLPDLGAAFPSMIAQYAAAGILVPLGDYSADPELGLTPEVLADFYPHLLEAGRFPGHGEQQLALPFVQNAIGLWVNESLLAQSGWPNPPRTWDEFEQACFDVWANTGVSCYPLVESVTTLNAWLFSRGGQQLDAAAQKALFNEPPGVESLLLLRRLIDAGLAWRPDEPYGDYVAFAQGQAAFAFSSTGNRGLYRDAYAGAVGRGMAPFQWRQVLIPQAGPQQPATALHGSAFFVVRGDPERERAAWRFAAWLTAPQQNARWVEELEAMPVRLSAAAWMTGTLESDPLFAAQMSEVLPYALPEPAVAAELDVRDILYTAILSVTQGYADPQPALDQAAARVDALLAGSP